MQNILTDSYTGLALLATLCVSILIQLIYYIGFYSKATSRRNQTKLIDDLQDGISVVIYSNNEYTQLKENLPYYLKQNYSNFEVIVVNDGNNGDIEDLMHNLLQRYDNIYYTHLSDDARKLSRHKMALTLGIKAARFDNIILSKAACRPIYRSWIHTIASAFSSKNSDFLVSPTIYTKLNPHTDMYCQLDKLFLNYRMLGYGVRNKPFSYGCSNIAFRKELFFTKKGFAKQMHLLFGEDILWINQLRKDVKGAVVSNPSSVLCVVRDNYLNSWKEEKQVYAFTSRFTDKIPAFVYSIETLSRYAYYASAIALICLHFTDIPLLITLASLVFLRTLFVMIFWHRASHKLASSPQYTSFLFYELVAPIVNVYFRMLVMFKNKKFYTWKL